MVWLLLSLLSLASRADAASLDPAHAARIMTDYMIEDATDRDAFQKWGYGQSIIMDALLLASEKIDGMDDVMSRWVNPVLDGFLAQPGSAAYNLTRNIPIDTDFIGNAVGDKIGLYPHAFLHRYLHYGAGAGAGAGGAATATATTAATATAKSPPPPGYNASLDLVVARQALDRYILR